MNANKPVLLFLYGVALYFVLKTYYKTNSGLPNPTVIRNPTYLYGILAIASDFTAGLTIPLAAGMTVALIWQTNRNPVAASQAGRKASPSQQSTRPTTSRPGARPVNVPTK